MSVVPPRILVADDEPSIRYVLREVLTELGCDVTEVEDGDAAAAALATGDFELAFLDIRMPGPSGLELLEREDTKDAATSVVIITAQNTFENAVEAMKRGAFDYLVKPFGMAEVEGLVTKARRARELQREVRELRREVGRRVAPTEELVGKSPEMLEVFKTIGRVAGRDVSVLVTGESGTGKELVARAVHAASGRADGPFVAVNTAAIPRELLESELFGHERGAFTGAVSARAGRFREASGGTLFLDEIGDMSPDLQAKLLRVVQEGEVLPVGGSAAQKIDVRIVAATHRDLDAAVAEGQFREDLLYRLRVVPLHLPALRERSDDVRVLAEHFVARYGPELSDGQQVLAADTIATLQRYPWPGNVRELENAIKRVLVLSSSELLMPEDFAFLGERPAVASAPDASKPDGWIEAEIGRALEAGEGQVYRDVIERIERPLIEGALARTDGNQIKAAALLGINRNTLRKKIVELEISIPGRE
jgi:two-component system nitrogen regulation response regulator GlnG